MTENIAEEGINVLGVHNVVRYKPKRRVIKVCKAENTLIVGFYFNENGIKFYQQKFDDGIRIPLGLEIDVIDYDNVFPQKYQSITSNNLPDNLFYVENHLGDEQVVHTVGINNPSQLKANQWYYVNFHFLEHSNVDVARFEVNLQLVADLDYIKNNYQRVYKEFKFPTRSGLESFWLAYGHSQGNNFFGIKSVDEMFDAHDFFFVIGV